MVLALVDIGIDLHWIMWQCGDFEEVVWFKAGECAELRSGSLVRCGQEPWAEEK